MLQRLLVELGVRVEDSGNPVTVDLSVLGDAAYSVGMFLFGTLVPRDIRYTIHSRRRSRKIRKVCLHETPYSGHRGYVRY